LGALRYVRSSLNSGGYVDLLGWYEKGPDHSKKKTNMERYNYWVEKGAPQSVGAGLSASIWWPFAVKLWCQIGVRSITKLSLMRCVLRPNS
jgi:hypothetical protein